MKHGKKYNESVNLIEKGKFYDAEEAVALTTKTATAKFDETVEIHVRLGTCSAGRGEASSEGEEECCRSHQGRACRRRLPGICRCGLHEHR